MRCPRMRAVWVTALAMMSIAITGTPITAQDAPTTFTSHIHAGTCIEPGEEIASLTDLVAANGPGSGVESGVTANAYSAIAVSIDSLLAAPSSIDIHDTTSDVVVACGEIGGVVANGGLTVGLRPMNDSGYSGIAYLSPAGGDASQTGISTFIAHTGATSSAQATPVDAATYVSTVRAQVSLVAGSLQRVDALFDAPQVTDPAWMAQLNAELELWRMLSRDAAAIVPPGEYSSFHEGYVAALALLDSASGDITTGLENGDQALLTQADQKISEAIEALRALDTLANATPAATPAT